MPTLMIITSLLVKREVDMKGVGFLAIMRITAAGTTITI